MVARPLSRNRPAIRSQRPIPATISGPAVAEPIESPVGARKILAGQPKHGRLGVGELLAGFPPNDGAPVDRPTEGDLRLDEGAQQAGAGRAGEIHDRGDTLAGLQARLGEGLRIGADIHARGDLARAGDGAVQARHVLLQPTHGPQRCRRQGAAASELFEYIDPPGPGDTTAEAGGQLHVGVGAQFQSRRVGAPVGGIGGRLALRGSAAGDFERAGGGGGPTAGHGGNIAFRNKTVKLKSCISSDDPRGKVLHTASMVRSKERNYLRAWREHRRLTQAKLADAVGTTGAVISLLESGERGLSDKWLRKLAPVLGTRPGHLLEVDPAQMDDDIFDIWADIPEDRREQARDVLKTFRLARGAARG